MKDLSKFRREYRGYSITDESMQKNPLELFDQWFREAVENETSDPNAMILSTTNHAQDVSSRVVLMKSYSKEGFTFFGNYNSKKGQQLSQAAKAGLLFYWPEMSRQIRIEGRVEKMTASESDAYFAKRPRGSQIAAHASPQSQPIESRGALDAKYQEVLQEMENKKIARPENWGGWILAPHRIEFWQGRENRLHDRIEYSISKGDWTCKRLAP